MQVQDYLAGRCLTQTEVQEVWKSTDARGQKLETWLASLPSKPALTGPPWVCGRCGNQDPRQFWTFQGLDGQPRTYCLDCLSLGRVMSGQRLYCQPAPAGRPLSQSPLTWQGELTPSQAEIAQKLVETWRGQERRPQLVWAVTGAGKTELVFPLLERVLMDGGRVCLASPRIDVCLELAPRVKAAFAGLDCQVLYGGSQDSYELKPLTLATTHQLLRAYQAFDCLIVDEVDAFPYVDSRALHEAVARALKPGGLLVYLTATPDDRLMSDWEAGSLVCHQLPARYHGHPLPLPQLQWVGDWPKGLAAGRLIRPLKQILQRFGHLEGPKLLFVPHIPQAQACAKLLKPLLPSLALTSVHASDPKRQDKIMALRQGKLDLLVTTTILERGVTLPHCQVCILGADDELYTRASLMQMSGRVGRSADQPTGALWWLHQGQSLAMRQAIQQLGALNQTAQARGLLRIN